MNIKHILLTTVLSLGCAIAGLSADWSTSITPVSRINQGWWKNRYDGQVQTLKNQRCDILFLGDSITDFWDRAGKNVWNEVWAPLYTCNFGISGDTTSELIWRIDDSGLPTLSDPKVCVIMIGTNNTGRSNMQQPPEQTALGILTVAQRLLLRYPHTQVFILAIFPRGATSQDARRIHNDKINAILAQVKLPRVSYVDINRNFLDAQGNLSKDLFPDLLHPSEKGYRIWADSLLPVLKPFLDKQ